MSDERPSEKPPETLPDAPGSEDDSDVPVDERLRRLRRTLRWRIGLMGGLALAVVLASGPALLLAPREILLVLGPVVLVIEFALGFALAGRLMALTVAAQHERLRAELLDQQERMKKALVVRWLALNPVERAGLREKFTDVDWDAIDELAGTAGEDSTRH